VDLLVLVGTHAGAAGITNVLFALGGIEQRLRQFAARAEQIDLEDQEVAPELSSSTKSSGVFEAMPPSQ
jgi:hypothetical protein